MTDIDAFKAAPTRVRFAPSPTGKLHVGNARMALMNWLHARGTKGSFLLRLDDTDRERSTAEFAQGIQDDLSWLGLDWDLLARQSDRFASYEAAVETLKAAGRLYPCYETPEELEFKRKRLLARKKPPIYDRGALDLSDEDRAKLEAEGRKPHWRFKLDDKPVTWDDLARGPQSYEAGSLSDPVLIRADGSFLYMLPSAVDDIEFAITHVIRGEDHVTNTAVQIQLFEALGGAAPAFAHTPLMTDSSGGGLSKRLGSTGLSDLKDDGIEAKALATYLATLGTNQTPAQGEPLSTLAEAFDIGAFGRSAPKFDPEQLGHLHQHTLHVLPFSEARERLAAIGLDQASEPFWNAVRPNLDKLADAGQWWSVCFEETLPVIEDQAFIEVALDLLPPEPWDETTWGTWTKAVKAETGAKGKALFMPLRLGLTGQPKGPELGALIQLMGRDRVVARLTSG
ncbi:MAG: glutamate--tRNA ligase [Magnetovibrionaceae bacterium]